MSLIKELLQLQEKGLITLRPNKSNTLFIANYTPIVQYERCWTPLLKQCRGLIVDIQGNIYARPFEKFFNIEEHNLSEIPNEAFEVFEKMDGSLGIWYFDTLSFKMATRGSFDSEQAKVGEDIMCSQYSWETKNFNSDFTYLFEIIYPTNRIVCDYGNTRDLTLLAVIETATGREIPLSMVDFPNKVKKYDGINDITELKGMEEDNREGFVVRFKSGFRLKVKFEEYVRLHRIVTQVSSKNIWEYLRDGNDLDVILEKVPDEFYQWVKKTKDELESKFNQIKVNVITKFNERPEFENRKEFAMWAKDQQYSGLYFSLLDGKDVDFSIWKMIKPEFDRPFKNLDNEK